MRSGAAGQVNDGASAYMVRGGASGRNADDERDRTYG